MEIVIIADLFLSAKHDLVRRFLVQLGDLVIKNFELLKMARVPGDKLEILEPLTLQIAGVEENIESIVRRNDVVDGEIQGMNH